jgi:hypothetical protein
VISALGSSILNLGISTLDDASKNFENVLAVTERSLPAPLRAELNDLLDSGYDLVGAAWQNAQGRGAMRTRTPQKDYGSEPRVLPSYIGSPDDPRSSM